MRESLINFLLFQTGWFACVLGGAWGLPLVGVLVAFLIISYHLSRATVLHREIRLLAIAMGIGFVFDSLLVTTAMLAYPSGMLLPGTAPYWIVVMWALFATTLNLSLRWLRGSFLLAVLFGAAGGPLAYYAGSQLGAVQFLSPGYGLVALAIGWAVFTPLLVFLSRTMDGFPRPAVN